MGTPLGSMQVELGLEASSFNASLTASKRAVNYFKAEIRGLDSALRVSGNNVQTLSAKQKTLKQAMEAQAKVLGNLKKKHDDLEASGRKGSAEWEANAVAIQRANAEMSNLESQLVSVGKAMDELTKKPLWFEKWQEAGKKLQGFGDGLQTVAKETALISGTVGAGLVTAAKSAMEFESAWTGVKKTVNGTDEQLEAVKNGIRQMALEIPASTTEIAGVAEAAGQLGVATEDVLSFTRTMIDLSQATNMTSEQASTSLARFAKITDLVTQHGVDGYSRLGSAIVELGNNTATTESEIVDLGMRLAAAGTQVGLTQAEIMGLAASMSSVGLSAEAGGTAMSTIMTKINTAVAEGGERLSEFASIAGMTAEDFARDWKDEPTKALELFTKGLGEALESGENVDAMLKELGVNGIRETDAIKRLGLAHKDLAKNFKMANDAFKDNSALSKEASQRYETMESKLQLLKNKLNDVAIEVGGPVIDALSDMIDAGEPVFELIKKMATGFSNLDKDTQRLLVTIAGLTAGFSPVIGGLGKLISWTGRVTEGVGLFGQTINGLKVAKVASDATSAGGAMAGMAGQVAGATGAVGGLSAKASLLAGLLSPTGALVVGGLAAAGAVAYFGAQAIDAQNRAEQWGTAVSKVEAEQLSSLKGTVENINIELAGFGAGAVDNIDGLKSSVGQLTSEIKQLAEAQLETNLELARQAAETEEEYAKMVQGIQTQHQNMLASTQGMADEIVQIYQNKLNHQRDLSEQEKAIVEQNTRALVEMELELLGFAGEQKKAVLEAFNSDVRQLNESQINNSIGQVKEWTARENAAYKEKAELIKQNLESSAIDKDEYNRKMAALETEHQAKLESANARLAELHGERLRKFLASNEEVEGGREQHLQNLKYLAEQEGLVWEDVVAAAESATQSLGKVSSYHADIVEGMSEDAVRASTAWNNMVFDQKTGELHTNLQEKIAEAMAAEGGWDNLMFMVKEANLTSNAQIEIASAIQASGRWDELTHEEKVLLVDGQNAVMRISESKELYDSWNSLPSEVKELLGDSTRFMQEGTIAQDFLNTWNSLPAEVKEILGDNTDFTTNATDAIAILDNWNAYTPEEKELLAKNLVEADTSQAQVMIDAVRQGQPVDIDAIDQTAPASNSANQSVNSPKQNRAVDIDAVDKTAAASSSANKSVNSPKQLSPAKIMAINLASSEATAATSSLLSIPTLITSTIRTIKETIFRNEKGTDFHPGGLAMVNDQKGSLYKELVTLPTGESFIPEGRDVILPLPRGSKVLTATRTRNLMNKLGIPKYAEGVGIPEDAKFLRDMERVQTRSVNGAGQSSQAEVVRLLTALLEATKEGQSSLPDSLNVVLKLGNYTLDEFATEIGRRLEKQEKIRLRTASR